MIESVIAAKLFVLAVGKASVVCKMSSGILGPSFKVVGLLPLVSGEQYERDRTTRRPAGDQDDLPTAAMSALRSRTRLGQPR